MTQIDASYLSGMTLPENMRRMNSITDEDRTSLSTAIQDNLGIEIDPTTVDGRNQLNAMIMNYADANGMSDADALTALTDGLDDGSITADDLAAYRDVTDGQLLLLSYTGTTKDDITNYAEQNGLSTFQAAESMIQETFPQAAAFNYD